MKKLLNLFIINLLVFAVSKLYGQDNFKLTENFDSTNTSYEKTGRGTCIIANSVLTTKDAYLSFGDYKWQNYEIKFKARVPASEDQVQICAGTRYQVNYW